MQSTTNSSLLTTRILFLVAMITIIGCENDLEPTPVFSPVPNIAYEAQPGELDYTLLISLIEQISSVVRDNAPGGLLKDTTKYGDTLLYYGLLPDNLNVQHNLTMRYVIHHDALTRIVFRDDTCTQGFTLARELGCLAESTIVLDSTRHFIALENGATSKVLEFPSSDSLWGYVSLNQITKNDIDVMISTWRDEKCCFSIAFAGEENLTTGQVRLLDSVGYTPGIYGLNNMDIDVFSGF